jgi:hypothetical protein
VLLLDPSAYSRKSVPAAERRDEAQENKEGTTRYLPGSHAFTSSQIIDCTTTLFIVVPDSFSFLQTQKQRQAQRDTAGRSRDAADSTVGR